jgi:plastocyanin
MKPALLAACLVLACGSEKSAKKVKVDAAAKQPAPVAQGVIRGTVAYAGAPQKRAIAVTEAACKGGPTSEDTVQVVDGKLVNAFVWVKSGLDRYAFPPASGEVVLDQAKCMYAPHVVGVRVGQPLVFSSSDPVTHNVHTLPEDNEPANFAMSQAGQRVSKRFDAPEVMIQTKCDIHPWMKAWIGVVDHPYFAVTGADGAFEFKGLPAGSYEVEVWHEVLGRKSQTVTLAENATVPLALTF